MITLPQFHQDDSGRPTRDDLAGVYILLDVPEPTVESAQPQVMTEKARPEDLSGIYLKIDGPIDTTVQPIDAALAQCLDDMHDAARRHAERFDAMIGAVAKEDQYPDSYSARMERLYDL